MCIAGVALLPYHDIAIGCNLFLASLLWRPPGLGNKSLPFLSLLTMLSKGTSLGQYHLSTTQGKHPKLPHEKVGAFLPWEPHTTEVDLKYSTGVFIALNPRQPYSAPLALSMERRAKQNAQTLPWPCTGQCKTQALCPKQTLPSLPDRHAYTVNRTPSPYLQRDTFSRCLCPTPARRLLVCCTKYTPVKFSQQHQAIK